MIDTRPRTLLPVVLATGAVVAAALVALGFALVRLLTWVTITPEHIARGVTMPAAAFDGVSTGTLSLGRMAVTNMFDGNDLPLPEAASFLDGIRAVVVPYYAAEAINAGLVLALSVVVLLLCLRLARQRPFVRHMTLSLAAFAVVLAAFSLASQLVRRIPFADSNDATWTIRKDFAYFMKELQRPLDEGTIWDGTTVYTPSGLPFPLDLTLVGVAALIALIAAAFSIGQRMQRDTEGLV